MYLRQCNRTNTKTLEPKSPKSLLKHPPRDSSVQTLPLLLGNGGRGKNQARGLSVHHDRQRGSFWQQTDEPEKRTTCEKGRERSEGDSDIPVERLLDTGPPHPAHLPTLVEHEDKTWRSCLDIMERHLLSCHFSFLWQVVDPLSCLPSCLGLDDFQSGGTVAKLVLFCRSQCGDHTSRAEEERRTAFVV